jgi:disulfide bond formation protein DsbB
MRYTPSAENQVKLLLALGSVVPLASALFSQYAMGLHPCELCLFQRVPYALIALLALVALFGKSPRRYGPLLLLAMILWVVEGGLALYHVGVEEGLWESATGCTSNASQGQSLEQLRQSILASPIISCADVSLRVLGLSMAAWNAVLAFGLMGVGMVSYRNIKRNKGAA